MPSRVAEPRVDLPLGRHVDERRQVDQRHRGEHGHRHAQAQRAADHALWALHPHRGYDLLAEGINHHLASPSSLFGLLAPLDDLLACLVWH